VALAGTDSTELDSDALRSVISLCEQDAHIFDSTLRENLRLALPAATADLLATTTGRTVLPITHRPVLDAQVGAPPHRRPSRRGPARLRPRRGEDQEAGPKRWTRATPGRLNNFSAELAQERVIRFIPLHLDPRID
jgi:hypothetical protein